jgi:hypothetical protein
MNRMLKLGVIDELRALAGNCPLEERLARARSSLILAMVCDSADTPDEVRALVQALRDFPLDAQDEDVTRLSLQAIEIVERALRPPGDHLTMTPGAEPLLS